MSLGHGAQGLHPCGLRYEILRIGFAAIDRPAPDFRHLGHVSRAALTAFDFHRGDIGGHQFRQQFQVLRLVGSSSA